MTIHYPLWLLTVNAGRYCLSSIPCHNLITLKWVAAQTVDGEAGWERICLETRCGTLVVGWVWIGWHGFGTTHFYHYILRRIDEGPEHGGPSFHIEDEYDKDLITRSQVRLGYYMHLALVPELTRLFNCRNRGKSAEHNLSVDAQRALLVGRTALMCSDDFIKHCLLIKMPAYSEANCKAAGVLSGVADLTGSLARYGESDLKVTSEPGSFCVELRGFRIAQGESSVSQIDLDFPSGGVDNEFFKTAVDRQLIFGYAGGASPDDREHWQERKIKEVLERIPPTADAMQPLVDGLFANRVRTRDVNTGASLEEDEEPPANFDYARYTDGALLPWDKRHENFAETAEALRVTYKTKIHRVSQPHVTADYLTNIWIAGRREAKDAAQLWREQRGEDLDDVKETREHAKPLPTQAFVTGWFGGVRFSAPSRAPISRTCKENRGSDEAEDDKTEYPAAIPPSGGDRRLARARRKRGSAPRRRSAASSASSAATGASRRREPGATNEVVRPRARSRGGGRRLAAGQ
ncbi:hypothetical protein JL720_7522 [Aureococcus anophagefferens]|nr:hypothetical protein JL720_7522 [Aureococcus anophagefferens]